MTSSSRSTATAQHPAAVRVTRTTAQSITQNSGVAVIWTGVEYDVPGIPAMWSAGTPTRLTAPMVGVYHAIGNTQFAPLAGLGFRIFYLVQNGGTIVSIANTLAGGTYQTGEVVSADVLMAAGDYLELLVYHNSAAALNLDPIYPMAMSLRLIYSATVQEWSGS